MSHILAHYQMQFSVIPRTPLFSKRKKMYPSAGSTDYKSEYKQHYNTMCNNTLAKLKKKMVWFGGISTIVGY